MKKPMQHSNGSMIGSYGQWAADLAPDPPKLSFRNSKWQSVADWKPQAMEKAYELLAPPKIGEVKVTVHRKYVFDGLDVEEISWQLPYGEPTKAVVLKPAGETKRLPAVLGLHDHGGVKYFGWEKICRISDNTRSMLTEHQSQYYEGRAWANEIAKKGYVVMVHDVFAFASRRVRLENVDGILWGHCSREVWEDKDSAVDENIKDYNAWASDHETIMAKSLLSAGTTWPGVVLAEDQVALTVLCEREDVDANRVGCCGLSGGGLRSAYLGGLDKRIKCAVCVGFMSTWRDFVMNKSFTHTFMTYASLLPNYLDFPEILGLRTPLPALVQSSKEDDLFTLLEMERADKILREIYAKAGEKDKYKTNFYEGGHKFDIAMQTDAFNWFDKWLA
ncbi:prolyl oligopeptidase family serine peptidase [uncultured Kriegella sp.]|uniref:prolyl oligopeptidase family serine peptidase n=1 Tax=uncultured Kriegella sp. TaxID=1798910 RepID=UPI0030DD9D46